MEVFADSTVSGRWGAVLCLVAQQPVEHVLDILTYRLTPEPPSSATSGVAGGTATGTSAPVAPSPFAITLVDLDRRVFSPGESLAYEVVLENISSKAVVLPWSPDRVRFAELQDAVRGTLHLEVRDAMGRTLLAHMPSQCLYGSPDVPDSLLTLAPRERARFRVPSTWWVSERELDSMFQQPNGLLSLTVVYLADLNTTTPRLHESSNRIDVTLQPRRLTPFRF